MKSCASEKHCKLLVVDDDSAIRRVLVDVLSATGISVAEARDGVEALEVIRSGSPVSALLLDLEMPRLRGADVIAVLRADPEHAWLPIVTMTGGEPPVGLTIQGHLAKPFLLGDLLATLSRVWSCECARDRIAAGVQLERARPA